MRTTKKKSREGKPTIDDMREDIAEQSAMTLQTSDIIELLLEGFEGIDNMPDIEIRDEWENLFGDEAN
jgi:hypothetical protein